MPIGPPDRRRRGPPQGVDTRGYEWANLPGDIARVFGRAGKAGLTGYATALTGVDDEGRTVGNVLPVARDERTGERALAAPRVLDLWNTVGGAVPARGITLGAGPVLRRSGQALDMSTDARMARAREMGFDVDRPVYHGTGADFAKHRGPIWGSETPELANEYAELREYMGGDPNVQKLLARTTAAFDADKLPKTVTIDHFFNEMLAQAKQRGQNVDLDRAKELLARVRRSARAEESGPHYARHDFWNDARSYFGADGAAAIDELTDALGFDSFKLQERGSSTIGVRDPKNIRSTQAAFDPARADSADLLAARAAPGAAASTVINEAGDALRASDLPDQIARLLREGRAAEVTDDMLGALGPNEQRRLYELYESGATGMDMPMDEASRMARAREGGFGEPEMYHSTAADFNRFKQKRGDIGPHVGTLGQAQERSDYLTYRGRTPENQSIIPLRTNVQNPLRTDDLGAWDADNLEYALREPYLQSARRAGTTSRVRKELERVGHDGIVYRNTGEVPGTTALSAEEDRLRRIATEATNSPPGSFSAEAQKHPAYQKYKKAYDRRWAHMNSDAAEDSLAVFDPRNIRSRHARFDPRLSNNADLLASRAAPGAGIGLGDPNRRRRLTWQELENLL